MNKNLTRMYTAQEHELEQTVAIDAAVFEMFLADLDVTPKTVRTYKTSLKQFFYYLYEKNITRPSRSDIVAYRDAQKERLKPTTVQNYMAAVKVFFKWTATRNFYPNIAEGVKGAVVGKEHKKDYLTSSQLQEIIKEIETDTATGKRNYALFLLMVTGGLRAIEAHRANVEDLRALGNTTVLYIQGKGREEKQEYIKITPQVEKALREYLKTRQPLRDIDPLFTSSSNNSQGQRLSTRSISGIIKESMREAGHDSDRLTAHSLRHTAVTLSLLGGSSLQEVQQFARHSNITTTQIYAHNLDRLQSTCEQSIEAAIFAD